MRPIKSDCLFCSIATHQIPTNLVYEDDDFMAFLDISPVIVGHTLIIPKKHYRWVHQVKDFGAFWEVAQKIAKSQLKALAAPTVVFATAGLEIPHAHIHVLPMPSTTAGEYLPGVESAKRIKMTSSQLQKTAADLRKSL